MDDSGRLGVHLPDEVTPDYGSGLFSVVKDQHRDRLIIDSRGANSLESPAQRWIQTLACGEALCRLLMEPGDTLKASGNDVRDFYHLFRATSSRSRRNVLASVYFFKGYCETFPVMPGLSAMLGFHIVLEFHQETRALSMTPTV